MALPGRKAQQIDYKYKTDPYAHQVKAFEMSRDRRSFALLMDMGTGKTKVTIDTACWLYARGEIRGVLIIAPNGVHSMWEEQIQDHLPDYCPRSVVVYDADDHSNAYKQHVRQALGQGDDLKFLAINVEALSSPKGVAWATKFCNAFKTLMVVDESTRIKNPKAKRSKTCLFLGPRAAYRRILSGTPVTQSPLDLYSQFEFLDHDILGFGSYFTFKHRYAITMKKEASANGKRWKYEKLIGFRNLEELTEKIKPHSFRVTKAECLDLPEKIYQVIRIPLKPEQRTAYDQMKSDYVMELEGGLNVTATMAMTRLTKLQQIIGGFVNDDLGNCHRLVDRTAKLDFILDDIQEGPTDTKYIIWCRFRAEILDVSRALKDIFGPDAVGTYFGDTDVAERGRIIRDFQDGKCRFFVGNTATAGHGLTLTAASVVYYYSNDFSFENRTQSEDRPHRIGQKKNVVYKDLVSVNTIDNHVLQILKTKRSISDLITTNLEAYRKILSN